jgi:hypothetical protein
VAHSVVRISIHIVIKDLSACNLGEVKLPGHFSEYGRQFLGGRSGPTRRGVRLVGIVGIGHGGVVVDEGFIFVLRGIRSESSKSFV